MLRLQFIDFYSDIQLSIFVVDSFVLHTYKKKKKNEDWEETQTQPLVTQASVLPQCQNQAWMNVGGTLHQQSRVYILLRTTGKKYLSV